MQIYLCNINDWIVIFGSPHQNEMENHFIWGYISINMRAYLGIVQAMEYAQNV